MRVSFPCEALEQGYETEDVQRLAVHGETDGSITFC